MKNIQNKSLKIYWQECLQWLTKEEMSKLMLATANRIRQGYAQVITKESSVFWICFSLGLFIQVEPVKELALYIPPLFNISHVNWSGILVMQKWIIFLYCLCLGSFFLTKYTQAVTVTLFRKDALTPWQKSWGLMLFHTIVFLLFLVLPYTSWLITGLELFILFFCYIAYFFYKDRKPRLRTLLLSIKNAHETFFYFLPFILLFLFPVILLLCSSLIINTYLLNYALTMLASLITSQTINSYYFFLIFATMPFIIALASILHTKIKYSYFTLFYRDAL